MKTLTFFGILHLFSGGCHRSYSCEDPFRLKDPSTYLDTVENYKEFCLVILLSVGERIEK